MIDNESGHIVRREIFRCTGQQLDAILLFGEQRHFDERPLQWVVAQYLQSPASRG
ncbi:hypothetical protein [Caballeronia sp. GAWG1-5s-s]|uniref:hypothetical protein n=1 Tax=Caballeronia sp. GAWG1-5s-s TaxID=2921743 RepID=UPI0020296E9A|nr:hypothetical protein [Caballeronia sp. GAWG1-5s-s]